MILIIITILKEMNPKETNLEEIKLKKTNLKKTNLKKTALKKTNLKKMNLKMMKFAKTQNRTISAHNYSLNIFSRSSPRTRACR